MEWDEEEVEVDLGNERVRGGVYEVAELRLVDARVVRDRVDTKRKGQSSLRGIRLNE